MNNNKITDIIYSNLAAPVESDEFEVAEKIKKKCMKTFFFKMKAKLFKIHTVILHFIFSVLNRSVIIYYSVYI